MTFKAPYLTYERVGQYANDFLIRHHPSLELPVPIEWIIESDLNLYIQPFPELYRIFNQSGFLSHNRTVIYIDDYQYDHFVEKYRFTLAHEVGHFVMHRAMYEGLSFDSMQEFIEWLSYRPMNEIGWFETQADWFAGQTLIPISKLETACVELLESNRNIFSNGKRLTNDFWAYASNELAKPFEVNAPVVEIRLKNSGLAEKYQDYYQKI
jgi:Zn-dependent peptidase ImmA (M78 family)